ncbi:hypothetical protein IWQ57_006773, partial [Coemansia nantahalensis]
MIHRRRCHQWALADEMRGLERIHAVVASIARPLPTRDGAARPLKGSPAPPDSGHLLAMPDTRLAKADGDADVSAICGIPALLNHPDDDEDEDDSDAAAAAPPPVPEAAAVPAAADADYAYHSAPDSSHPAMPAPAAAAAVAPDHAHVYSAAPAAEYSYHQSTADYHAHQQHQQRVADRVPAASGSAGMYAEPNGHGYASDDRYRQAGTDHHRHTSSHSRVADLLHPGPEPSGAATYYDTPSVPAAGYPAGPAGSKHEMAASAYEDSQSKRQRMMQHGAT